MNTTQRLKMLWAEFFYSGRSPYFPGTCGSLASLPLWFLLTYLKAALWTKILIITIIFFSGVWCSKTAILLYQKKDPKQVVIDEVVGMGITCLFIKLTAPEILAAFLFFRFFDIFKPWPIRAIEKSFPNEWGVMLDDVAAGILALILHYFLFYLVLRG